MTLEIPLSGSIPLSGWEVLHDARRRLVQGFLAGQAAARNHLVVTLAGVHALGIPSAEGGLELDAIHVARTAALVGLDPQDGAVEQIELRGGLEIDYRSHEVGAALRGVIAGDGAFAERLLGEHVLAADEPRLASLRPLVHAALSRRAHRHYLALVSAYRRAAEASPTATRVLCVLRAAATGIHLLRSGELITDVGRASEALGLEAGAVHELIAIKRAGEEALLRGAMLDRWRAELTRLIATLAGADEDGALPEAPPAEAISALDAWLRDVRRASW